jgi:hypothetical protein
MVVRRRAVQANLVSRKRSGDDAVGDAVPHRVGDLREGNDDLARAESRSVQKGFSKPL